MYRILSFKVMRPSNLLEYVFCCFLFFHVTSYSQQTVQTFYDAEKKIKKEIYHTKQITSKNEKDGLYQIFFENGKNWQEGDFKEGKLEGEWKIFYPNGTLKQTLHYSKGLRQGNSKIYYDDGGLFQEPIYKDDKLNGKIIFYHPNGKTMEISDFKNDSLDGLSI